jgi:hydrogenase-4 membrane subunit HyfE
MPVGGTFVADVGHLMFAATLALAFAVLTRRSVAGMRDAARIQSAVVAATAGWQAWAAGSATLAALALIVLVGGAGVLPWTFGQGAGNVQTASPRTPVAVVAAASLVVLAILIVLPAHLAGVTALRDNLACTLATVLVALFILAARQGVAQIAGLWTLANGLALAGILVESAAATAGVAGLFGLVAATVVVRPAEAP